MSAGFRRARWTALLSVAVAVAAGGAALAPLGGGATTLPPLSSYDTPAQVEALVASSVSVNALPSDYSPSLTALANNDDWGGDLQNKSHCAQLETAQYKFVWSTCVWGDKNAKFTVALYGDSRAQMLLDELNDLGLLEKFRVVLMAKVGCPAPLANYQTDTNGTITATAYTACTKFHTEVIGLWKTLKPNVILISSTFHLYIQTPTPHEAAASEVATDTTALLDAAPSKSVVAIVGGFPSPAPNANPTLCVSREPSNLTSCAFAINAARVAEYAAVKTAVQAKHGYYLNQYPFFCTSSTCPALVGTIIPYTIDASHGDKTFYSFLTDAMWTLYKPVLTKAGWRS